MESTAITKIIEESGVELEKAKRIWVQFEDYFDGVTKCSEEVEGLEITDVSQKEEMNLARATRIKLKNIRIAAEKTKKALKADIIKEGKFIDTTFNLIANTTKPIEDDLLEKEQFAKRKEAERIEKITFEREIQLEKYVTSSSGYPLAKMTEEEFQELLGSSRVAYDQRIEAERKAEEERQAKEKAEAEERARIEAENARLRAEAEERERLIAEQWAKLDVERRARDEADRRERDARELADRAEREKYAAEIRKAQDAEANSKRELRENQEAQELVRIEESERVEAERKAEEVERQRLSAASDKDRLSHYLEQVMAIEMPNVGSDADVIIRFIRNCLLMAVSRVEKL
jgi:hypothetical protein